ncbi:uncharacterized protein LOC115693142 isoform X2 [Syzygium oleosum]|uniref:uncharacterized protein LOC115693142 isoform X2 n=1 Tax=Syzygium oleosum TaxID=219896 RepID=UPI0024BB210A|nr:uncharacterized protein LOC115693142 isoform X2 [Syzygium oleosum]
MATHEKPRKLGSFMNFYKSGAAATVTGKVNLVAKPDPSAFTNKYITRGWTLRKSPHCPESERGDDQLVRANSGRGGDGRGGGSGGSRGGGGNEMVVEARKSVSHVETNLASVVAFLQVKVMVADMPGFMQVHAFRCARRTYDSLEKFSSKHMAYNMKKRTSLCTVHLLSMFRNFL